MAIFSEVATHGHEQVVFCHDKVSGLRAIIAIHDTTLGPALGGARMWPYRSEEEALTDALRLARGMTYKAAAMGLDLGGGKAVIWGDPRRDKTEALLRAFGRFVHSLAGRYITAEDVGTTVEDMAVIRRETPFVAGQAELSGDPSPVTAFGVYRGMKAAARWVWGNENLKGRTVAVQGVGKVGYHLCRHLADEGARLVVTDVSPEAAERAVRDFGARAVPPEAIYDVPCDIYAPCALGATLNDDTIPRLKCQIVAGSANNQLQEPRHAQALQDRGILYAPDYVINGGGLVNVSEEFHPSGYSRDRAYARVATIYDKLLEIFTIARDRGITTAQAADVLAEERIATIHRLRRIHLPRGR
ncbi:Glu/Leu/Phe/Val dehydrogenase dimerization domain-containing protein [Caldinitratiruptor microaerophilus]|uniref:Leucine dehydrogenase n=1 Tax=Caldinitratiruptor microaerophilus TaxID=671077 RepID=A0AA35CJ03_9FIRM|nr:Glu/Leu/Phe/Val dehydrogenase dimerization domain-containing protein [Caldinitratiruptor microaerophilus]BDG59947.1 leucine dehydrogenase [Caldinitratiruptor microaerophilus]